MNQLYGKLFRLAYPVPTEAWHIGIPLKDVRVQATGEFRQPKKGEWYISGAIPEGYRAPNDLSSAFHIGRLVRVQAKTEVTEIVTEVLS